MQELYCYTIVLQLNQVTLNIALRQSSLMDMHIVIQHTIWGLWIGTTAIYAMFTHRIGIHIGLIQGSMRSRNIYILYFNSKKSISSLLTWAICAVVPHRVHYARPPVRSRRSDAAGRSYPVGHADSYTLRPARRAFAAAHPQRVAPIAAAVPVPIAAVAALCSAVVDPWDRDYCSIISTNRWASEVRETDSDSSLARPAGAMDSSPGSPLERRCLWQTIEWIAIKLVYWKLYH